jgi:hypothetical protein
MVGSRLAVGLPAMFWLKRSFGPLWSISLQLDAALLGKAQCRLGRVAFGVEAA